MSGTNGAGGDPTAGGQATSGAAPSGFDWRGALGPDGAALLPMVEAKGWKHPREALTSYAQLEKTLGSERVALPKDENDAAAWDGLFTRLGMPADENGYELKRPDQLDEKMYDEIGAGEFRKIARSARLTKAQAQAVHDWFAGRVAVRARDSGMAAQEQRQQAVRKLQAEFGENLEPHITAARRAVAELGGDELAGYLAESGLGNDPRMVIMMARLGRLMAEDSVVNGRTSPVIATADQARKELARIQGEAARDPKHPYNNPRTSEGKALAEHVDRLYRLTASSAGRQRTGNGQQR